MRLDEILGVYSSLNDDGWKIFTTIIYNELIKININENLCPENCNLLWVCVKVT